MSLLPTAAGRIGLPVEGARVVIHGFGNVGQYAAVAAAEMGCRVVGISDVSGGFHNEAGIDVDAAMAWMADHRSLGGFDGGDAISNEDLLELDCEVLVPAAVGGVITSGNADRIKARIVIEGANGPTTMEADGILRDNGVMVIPDILANAGGVTVSYFEWVQDLQNYFWTENEIVGRLREIMSTSFAGVLDIADRDGVDLRTAALIKGIRRVAAAKLARGVFP
jgi:glutamate dehydrogenase (NAD(P)+)